MTFLGRESTVSKPDMTANPDRAATVQRRMERDFLSRGSDYKLVQYHVRLILEHAHAHIKANRREV